MEKPKCKPGIAKRSKPLLGPKRQDRRQTLAAMKRTYTETKDANVVEDCQVPADKSSFGDWLLEQDLIENQTGYVKSNDNTGDNEDNQNKTSVADEKKDPDYTEKNTTEEKKDSENKGKSDNEIKENDNIQTKFDSVDNEKLKKKKSNIIGVICKIEDDNPKAPLTVESGDILRKHYV